MKWYIRACRVCGGDLHEDPEDEGWVKCLLCARSLPLDQVLAGRLQDDVATIPSIATFRSGTAVVYGASSTPPDRDIATRHMAERVSTAKTLSCRDRSNLRRPYRSRYARDGVRLDILPR